MLPSTVGRVPQNTAAEVNEQIRRRTEESIAWTIRRGPVAVERRLAELDREWDIERLLEANASTIILAGLVLGTTANRKFLLVPAGVAAFLLLHALQGWCPPLPILRRLGVRTQAEIESERYALKALRGDFAETGRDEPRDRLASRMSLDAARS